MLPAAALSRSNRRWLPWLPTQVPAVDPDPSLFGVPHHASGRGGPYRAARPEPEVVRFVRHSPVRKAPPYWGRLISQARTSEVRRERHQLNIGAIVARLSAKPSIRVVSGTFVGRFRDQEYALGSTETGLARAIRRLSELRRAIQTEV